MRQGPRPLRRQLFQDLLQPQRSSRFTGFSGSVYIHDWLERKEKVVLLLGIAPTTLALCGGIVLITMLPQKKKHTEQQMLFSQTQVHGFISWTDGKTEIICLSDGCSPMGMVLFQRHQQMFISLIEYYDLVISNIKQGFQ